MYNRFSESKSEKILYVERIVACFGLKREIFFKVQLCTDAFLRRKAEDVWRLAKWYLVLAENDNPLPLASLFSNFSTAKRLHSKERKQKPFAAQTPPRKRGYFSTHQTIVGKNFPYLRNFLSSLADAPHCSIMGFVQTQTISEKVLFFIFSDSQQDKLFCPARYREMTLLNFSFMFCWREVKIRFCFAGTK